MAVEQRISCDHCGSVILEGRSLLTVEAGPLRARRQTADLCATCAEELAAWLVPPVPPPSGPKEAKHG